MMKILFLLFCLAGSKISQARLSQQTALSMKDGTRQRLSLDAHGELSDRVAMKFVKGEIGYDEKTNTGGHSIIEVPSAMSNPQAYSNAKMLHLYGFSTAPDEEKKNEFKTALNAGTATLEKLIEDVTAASAFTDFSIYQQRLLRFCFSTGVNEKFASKKTKMLDIWTKTLNAMKEDVVEIYETERTLVAWIADVISAKGYCGPHATASGLTWALFGESHKRFVHVNFDAGDMMKLAIIHEFTHCAANTVDEATPILPHASPYIHGSHLWLDDTAWASQNTMKEALRPMHAALESKDDRTELETRQMNALKSQLDQLDHLLGGPSPLEDDEKPYNNADSYAVAAVRWQ